MFYVVYKFGWTYKLKTTENEKAPLKVMPLRN